MKIIPDKLLKSNFQLTGSIENISFADIVQLVQKKFEAFYDKYLIDTKQNLYKTKLIYTKYNVNALHKEVKKISFPYFKELRPQIDKIIAGKNEKKSDIFDFPANIITFLEKRYGISPVKIDNIDGKNAILFVNSNEIDEYGNYRHEIYGVSEHASVETCKKCEGNKYVTCISEECKGLHSWICNNCSGEGRIACEACCKTGYMICNTCNGKGDMLCIKCKGKDKNCNCCNNGVQSCILCNGKGEMVCNECNGTLYNTCKICDGTGFLTCNDCSNLDEHYGKTICTECSGMGKVVSFLFVDGEERQYYKEVIFNEKLDVQNILDADKIYVHCNRLANSYEKTKLIEPKAKASILEDLLIKLRREFYVKKTEYPLILHEELYFEEVPVVKFFARHILTNTVHLVILLDIFKNPEIIIESDPEKTKRFDVNDTLKSGVQFIAKLLKTKQHSRKEDLHKQIFLLIYAAKADGNIAEEEKYFLVEAIGSMSQFTNKEKKEFFDLLGAEYLRPLHKGDVTFSTNEKYLEVLGQIESIIGSDGEEHQLEQEFAENIRKLHLEAMENMNKQKKII